MLKNSTLNTLCLYSEFFHDVDYTVPELLMFISHGIQCAFMFDDRLLSDDEVKRLRREWCKLLKVEDRSMTVTYGLTSRCVESPLCLAFTVQARREEIAGAPRNPICDIIVTE
jgi:hypothetical protein